MDGSNHASIQSRDAGESSLSQRELSGQPAVAAWLEALCARYAEDVRWTAPRRGIALVGRGRVMTHLARELAAMADPRVCVLRCCDGQTQSFHEFTIRFHLVAPGIEGVRLPVGAEVELERLRVLTHGPGGQVAAESCIETWTWLGAGRNDR
ncbi:MAG TPA: nuclear transport factor 2 family protein [Steroidobacteraceae bacterium]|nr:nuclear transport factor 2 family protein [Steroidobacteraceae bacterium]